MLGIFMCACIVGMLWYLAGIGDAIMYRERMAAGADSVAFSGAVLHARGMNLIVLLNFAMACVLAIRVALRVAAVILYVVGTIVSWIIPISWAGPPLITAGQAADRAANASKQAIDGVLEALSGVQRAVARIVPPAALAGSYQVGSRYRPMVRHAIAGSPTAVAQGLPVEEGSEDKLCEEAGRAVASLFMWATGLEALGIPSRALNKVEGFMAKAVRTGGAYFCGLGSGGSPPDFSSELSAGAAEGCDNEKQDLVDKYTAADNAYWSACEGYAPPCPDEGWEEAMTPAQQSEMANLSRRRAEADQAVQDFDHDACVTRKKQDLNSGLSDRMSQNGGGSSGGRRLTPKKVKDDWHNGINAAQVVSVATGNTESLTRSTPTLVRLGAWREQADITVPTTAEFALAQAEFFFDCAGRWSNNNDCNGPNGNDSNAMWRFRWRARLRRFNAPFSNGSSGGLQNVAGLLAGADAMRIAIFSINPNSITWQNASVLAELGRAARDPGELIIH